MPLSDRALAVLDEARELPQAGNFVFPSQKGRMQGHHPMGRMMRKLEIGAVPHARPRIPATHRGRLDVPSTPSTRDSLQATCQPSARRLGVASESSDRRRNPANLQPGNSRLRCA